MNTSVHIVGLGALCAVGLNVAQIHAAVRGRLNGFRREDRFPSIRTGQPLTLALLPGAAGHGTAADRMIAAGVRAATECLAAAGGPGPAGAAPLPVLLSLPALRTGWAHPDAMRTAALLMARLPCAVDPVRSGMVLSGHQGGLAMMAIAHDLITRGDAQACLVGGVECYDAAALDAMDRQGHLKADDTPHGFVPGEAAGFVLLASDAFMQSRNLPARVVLTAVAQEVEPQPWYTAQPTLGQGLGAAFQAVLGPEGRRADTTYSDQNGQNWRVDEWIAAYLRTGGKHGEPLDHRHPADCWGDVGAASGPMLMALACRDLHDGWARRAGSALVACSSYLAPYRAAALVARTDTPHPA